MGRNDSDSDSDEVKEPVSSFQSLFAEGDILAKQGSFKKAIVAYTKALAMKLDDKNCLVARSKCHLQLGDMHAALEDANLSLKGDLTFFKGVYQKAEALYAKGDFEMALVFYHRGNKLRPELDEFRLGIQKSREAIDNSIGNPKDYKFQAPPGTKITAQGNIIIAPVAGGVGSAKLAGGTAGVQMAGKQPKDVAISGKQAKQLLGELYTDKEFLENFLADPDFEHNPNQHVMSLVGSCLKYIDTRTEFWRQQKPIYARRKEHSKVLVRAISARNRALINEYAHDHKERESLATHQASNPKAGGGVNLHSPVNQTNKFTAETSKYVKASMNVVTQSIEKGNHQRALQTARNLLTRLTEIKNLPNRDQAVSDVTSAIGNIYMQLESLPQAMQFYRKDLSECRTNTYLHASCLPRALTNMGRICVKLRRFDEAISAFEQKLSLDSSPSTTPAPTKPTRPVSAPPPSLSSASQQQQQQPAPPVTLETAWLLHDIGRCHLEMGRDEVARQKGVASLKVSEAVKDRRWALNALVLIGQVEVRTGRLESASKVYTKALTYAKEVQDERASNAISEALNQLRSGSVGGGDGASVRNSLVQTRTSSASASRPSSSRVGGVKNQEQQQGRRISFEEGSKMAPSR
ncbi:Tetratricopeptide repeat protein 25 [Podochytrium sp. JEL0797]|nr:Tetratricopeptide repeat protein 25 [Podochytrium sp. JEL0797]